MSMMPFVMDGWTHFGVLLFFWFDRSILCIVIFSSLLSLLFLFYSHRCGQVSRLVASFVGLYGLVWSGRC